METYHHILVRTPNWIGDFILAQDFLAGLRAAYPAARITLACPAEMQELVDRRAFEVLPLERRDRKWVTGWRKWAGEIRAGHFDCALTLASSLSAALLLRVARIPRRVGFADPGAGFFLTDAVAWPGRSAGQHKSALYRMLLRSLTGEVAPARTVPVCAGRGPIVLAPGASIALREWPGFVELARRLRRLYPQTEIRVVGTKAQALWEPAFAALEDPGVQSLVGKTTLPELIELCRRARFVVANDSGVAHVAATLAGAPTVVLFGPGDPNYVAPRGAAVQVARHETLACSPCESATCRAPFGYQQCLRSLSVEKVLESIATLN